MKDIVYTRDNFIIFRVGHNFIVYNKKKPFESGHTHIKNKKSAIDAVNFVITKKIPKRTAFYYLQSLIRISTDEKYILDIQSLIDTRTDKGKKPKYFRSYK